VSAPADDLEVPARRPSRIGLETEFEFLRVGDKARGFIAHVVTKSVVHDLEMVNVGQ
jgi:hypothetical protein